MNEQEMEIDNYPALANIWDELPLYDPTLVKNMLRKEQKMLILGPEKSCKTIIAIQLALGVASGGQWLEQDCVKGNVLYVNFNSSIHSLYSRFREIYDGLAMDEQCIENIHVINLKGNQQVCDYRYLSEMLICKSINKGCRLIIIDSIDCLLNGQDERSGTELNTLLDNLAIKANVCLAMTATIDKGLAFKHLSETVAELIPTDQSAKNDYRLSVQSNSFKHTTEKVLRFNYPIIDVVGSYNAKSMEYQNEAKKKQSLKSFEETFDRLSIDGRDVRVSDIADELGIARESLYRKVSKMDDYQISVGIVEKINNE